MPMAVMVAGIDNMISLYRARKIRRGCLTRKAAPRQIPWPPLP
jgi:hypothetical protein